MLFCNENIPISFFFQYPMLNQMKRFGAKRVIFFLGQSPPLETRFTYQNERPASYVSRTQKAIALLQLSDSSCRALKQGGRSDEEKEERCDVIFIRENYSISYIYVNGKEGKGISANGTLESRNKYINTFNRHIIKTIYLYDVFINCIICI